MVSDSIGLRAGYPVSQTWRSAPASQTPKARHERDYNPVLHERIHEPQSFKKRNSALLAQNDSRPL